VWERARHEIALPAGHENVLTVGGEHSLWDPLLRDFLVWMRSECPDVAVRVHIDVADRLMEQVQDGVVDVALIYAPPRRTGVTAELLVDEKLVAVSTAPDRSTIGSDDYVYVDWGEDFASNHHAAFPDARASGMAINHGPLAMKYILSVGGSAYLRLGAARPHLDAGRLFVVEEEPSFGYSVYAVYSSKADEELMDRARHGLRIAAHASHFGQGREIGFDEAQPRFD
jgi:DNA-binding transcriptional LysR family regulator